MAKNEKWTTLNHKKHGVGGVIKGTLRYRKQDKRFITGEMYAVVFFPRIHGIPKAGWRGINSAHGLAESPELAIEKFMEGIAKTETWETYREAGHRVRKIRISDLGDATAEG